MKRKPLLLLVGSALIVFILIWCASEEAPRKLDTGSSLIEGNLQAALEQLRSASAEERRTKSWLVAGVMTLSDALEDVGDLRQKQVATDARKEVGRILFGEAPPRGEVTSSPSGRANEVVPFPGALPELPVVPLPLESYAGTYSGVIVGRPVDFIVAVTNRGLLGVRIVGLGDQPTMEFAQIKPQQFFRPDSMVLIDFVDPIERGFRAVYFQQYGIRAKAENMLFRASPSK